MNLKTFKQKFKLDSHHKMERFSFIFIFYLLVLGILFGISFKIHMDHQRITLSTKALYTRVSKWSLTGQGVKVLEMYRNTDSSRIFILFQTGGGPSDMATMSTDANDYRIFMTGYNGDELTNNPRAAFYVFGNTGYMGMYFVDSRGFDSHLYDIVVRNTNVLTSDVEPADESYGDPSFSYHNQIRIYANFAGTDAKVAAFLNEDNFSLQEIYGETVAALKEAPIREKLDNDLLQMNNDMSLVNQYASQLSAYNIRVPDLPNALAGDAITLDASLTSSNPSMFDPSMVNARGDVIQSEYNDMNDSYQQFQCVASADARNVVPGQAIDMSMYDYNAESEDNIDDNGDVDSEAVDEEPKDENQGRLYLITDYVFPGGCQYDYQTTALMDSNFMNVIPDGMNFLQWKESKAMEQKTYATIRPSLSNDYYDTWYTTDGSIYNNDPLSEFESDQVIRQAMENYSNTILDLYRLKYEYQTVDLYQLLQLRANADVSDTMFSVNKEDNVLIMYNL